MDVLNEQALHDKVVDPAISRLNSETIPSVQKALADALTDGLANAASDVEKIVDDAITKADAVLAEALSDVSGIIRSLDGWTVEIGPITIPAILIRLTKPKETK